MNRQGQYPRFTDDARAAMVIANRTAMQLGSECIGVGHMLVGVVEADPGIRAYLPEQYSSYSTLISFLRNTDHPEKTGYVRVITETAMKYVQSTGGDEISVKHLLLAIVTDSDEILSAILDQAGTDAPTLKEAVLADL
ncbi:MAG: hypothetical protein HON04_11495 [Planctomicrobium sp.]|jgi:ATP-dependent Clp protease ATP-binding subunit ClpA|nr:hypothetical protein [Planctomicrobium sp.]